MPLESLPTPRRRSRLLVLVACLLVARAASGCAAGGPREQLAAAPAVPARARVIDLLHAWDQARAQAYADGDVAALQALYDDGSKACAADVALLRAYRARGVTVQGLTRQTSAVRVVAASPHRLVVRLTDRLASAVAVGPGWRRALPQSGFKTRDLVLVRTDEVWRVRSVVDRTTPSPGAGLRPGPS